MISDKHFQLSVKKKYIFSQPVLTKVKIYGLMPQHTYYVLSFDGLILTQLDDQHIFSVQITAYECEPVSEHLALAEAGHGIKLSLVCPYSDS